MSMWWPSVISHVYVRVCVPAWVCVRVRAHVYVYFNAASFTSASFRHMYAPFLADVIRLHYKKKKNMDN